MGQSFSGQPVNSTVPFGKSVPKFEMIERIMYYVLTYREAVCVYKVLLKQLN